MVYRAALLKPELWTGGVAPQSGLPLNGTWSLDMSANNPGIVHFHGRKDQTIGYDYDVIGDGWTWYYELGPKVIQQYAESHNCSGGLVPIKTDLRVYNDRVYSVNLECSEYLDCEKPVKRCLFDGKHDMPGWEANIIWFLFTGEQIEFPEICLADNPAWSETCTKYKEEEWCADCKEGPNWDAEWGSLENFDILENCCETCGCFVTKNDDDSRTLLIVLLITGILLCLVLTLVGFL